MLYYLLGTEQQVTVIDGKINAETGAREDLEAKQASDILKLNGDLATLDVRQIGASAKLTEVEQAQADGISRIKNVSRGLSSLDLKIGELSVLPDDVKLSKASATRAMVKADQAYLSAIQINGVKSDLESLESLVAAFRYQLSQARISSWFWKGPEIATGEDTDGAGTNGGGIVAGGVDLSTHQYDDGDGTVSVLVYDHGTTTWEDLKTSSNLASWTNNYQLMPDNASEEANDAFAIGWDNIFPQVAFDDLATGNGQLATYGGDAGKWQYSDGQDSWVDLPNMLDRTDTTAGDGKRPLQQVGSISFLPPADWTKATYKGLEKYWIRWVVTAAQITQEAIIDDTNKDEPFVVVPDSNNFICPVRCYVDAITLANRNTVHDQAIKFIFGEFTSIAPSSGPSFSAQQTWTASKAVQRFDLSAQRPELQQGSVVGIHIQDDAASTNNPIISVGMEVTLI